MKYLWVIGGGQLQIPLIEEANKLGLHTIVSDINPACVAKGLADIFVPLDIFDTDGHINYIKSHNDLNVVGVLAAGIDAPETMAAMNAYLKLKGVSVKIAEITKNKHLFRQRLQELDYPVPEFLTITDKTLHNQLDALKRLIYPIIVKPVNNSGSRDMKIFNTFSNMLVSFITHNLEKYPLLLIEEMWIGKEQTVECLVDIEGKFHRGFITDRHFTFQDGFPIETALVHPTELDSKTQEELYALAQKLSVDLGVTSGAVKLDTIVTDKGARVIEMTVRHSGGFDCQYLVPRSTGKNILKAAILTATQELFDPQLLYPQFQRYGGTASIWPEPGIIQSITGLEKAKEIPGVEEIFMRYNIGDRVQPYIDCAKRVAFIVATGETREDVTETLDKVIETLKVQTA